MGHVFADCYNPENSKCDEWRWFGWEVAVARQIGAMRTWSRQNSNYAVGGGADWGHLSASQRRAVIAHRLVVAREIGVLDADNRPWALR